MGSFKGWILNITPLKTSSTIYLLIDINSTKNRGSVEVQNGELYTNMYVKPQKYLP